MGIKKPLELGTERRFCAFSSLAAILPQSSQIGVVIQYYYMGYFSMFSLYKVIYNIIFKLTYKFIMIVKQYEKKSL